MSSGSGRMRVGKYELGRTLGEGTFAKVKFARNARTGENVAIKILNKEKIIRHKMVNQCIDGQWPALGTFWLSTGRVMWIMVCLGEYLQHVGAANDLYVASTICLISARKHEDHGDRSMSRKTIICFTTKIKREIATMKLIRHPNVIRMHEVMASKTTIYLVLEFVTGGELFDKITSHGRFREVEARKYFQQLINAVDYCHSRGVFHRDLKPENLLLDSSGILKVSDFGLSALPQQVREDGLLHTTCGTPNYVAPEVISDKGYDGAKADLWSCGVILFVLMAGYLPFEDSNLASLYKKIFKADFTCPSWFSTSAKKLIKRILDPNPETRITISEVLENDWFKKGYQPPSFEMANVNLDDVDALFNESEEAGNFVLEKREERPSIMNAFELISTSQGLNLGTLFEKQAFKRVTRFASKLPPSEILSKIEAAATPLGFDLKLQGQKTGRKGHLFIAAEVFEVAPLLNIVELRKSKGDTLEFNSFT
ncbi:putative protein kinase CAMK-CAMKL-CHK1 family [Dioscorea sansibarensis]